MDNHIFIHPRNAIFSMVGLMAAIKNDWIGVSLEGTVAIAVLWPLFIQALFWLLYKGHWQKLSEKLFL
jgi:hypothetical protein